MKVLYDYRIFDSQQYGGASRYFTELIRSFRASGEVEAILSIGNSENEYIGLGAPDSAEDGPTTAGPYLASNLNWGLVRKLRPYVPRPFNTNPNLQTSISDLKGQSFDLFHPTYYDSYFLKYLGRKPFVFTIYDMAHEIYPEMFSMFSPISRAKKVLAEKATRIIAISKTTKNDITRILKVPSEKIDVVYPGSVGDMRTPNGGARDFGFGDYIIYVGSRDGYKNFERFVIAVSRLLKKYGVRCLCCGGGKFTRREVGLFQRLGILSQLVQYSAKERDLPQLYQNALCFVCPSLNEGFGLPVVEAFSYGCPVALANTSALPEVAGDGAVYFDPKDEEDISAVVETLISSDHLRDEMIGRGRIQCEKYSWAKCAKETLGVYRAALREQ